MGVKMSNGGEMQDPQRADHAKFGPGAHKVSKNLQNMSNFYAPEGWYEANSIRKTQKY
jgi:hypothetical protein